METFLSHLIIGFLPGRLCPCLGRFSIRLFPSARFGHLPAAGSSSMILSLSQVHEDPKSCNLDPPNLSQVHGSPATTRLIQTTFPSLTKPPCNTSESDHLAQPALKCPPPLLAGLPPTDAFFLPFFLVGLSRLRPFPLSPSSFLHSRCFK